MLRLGAPTASWWSRFVSHPNGQQYAVERSGCDAHPSLPQPPPRQKEGDPKRGMLVERQSSFTAHSQPTHHHRLRRLLGAVNQHLLHHLLSRRQLATASAYPVSWRGAPNVTVQALSRPPSNSACIHTCIARENPESLATGRSADDTYGALFRTIVPAGSRLQPLESLRNKR
ncbi:hypothetical protein GY45DRAFT_206560 [Cubamyces sp. BRFM 1775]|nr:hypothetical protein GY45DRAFT_206560 [Cubamyces sp. BRFM 1775]